jgi:hypothetical protein
MVSRAMSAISQCVVPCGELPLAPRWRPGLVGIQFRLNIQEQIRVAAAGQVDESRCSDVTASAGLRGSGVALVVGHGFGGGGGGSVEQAGRNSSATSSITVRPITHVT